MPLPIYTSSAFTNGSGVNVAANASVEVRSEADDSLVTLYSDRLGANQINNPFQADEHGRFAFFANPNADGWRITVTSGMQSEMLRFQQPMGSLAGAQASEFMMDFVGAEDAEEARSTLGAAAAGLGALVSLSADQSIATNTQTTIAWDSEEYDTSSIHDNATNNSRLTVPSGVTRVRLAASITFATNATGRRSAQIFKNGAAFAGMAGVNLSAASGSVTLVNIWSAVVPVTEGDYFEVSVLQDSGGALDVLALEQTWFSMEIIA